MTVAAIDCDVETNKPLCGRYEVRGFPTLKVFPGDRPKSGKKSPTDYQGLSPAAITAPARSCRQHPGVVGCQLLCADVTLVVMPAVAGGTDGWRTAFGDRSEVSQGHRGCCNSRPARSPGATPEDSSGL